MLACDAAELADAASELASERAPLALEAADDRSEDAAAALLEMADSALLSTEDALVGLGTGNGRMVMSLDFKLEAREVISENSADTMEVAVESASEALEVTVATFADFTGNFVKRVGIDDLCVITEAYLIPGMMIKLRDFSRLLHSPMILTQLE